MAYCNPTARFVSGVHGMEKAEKLLALLTLVIAITVGVSSWLGGASDPGCFTPM
jgi:hypothetical protein